MLVTNSIHQSLVELSGLAKMANFSTVNRFLMRRQRMMLLTSRKLLRLIPLTQTIGVAARTANSHGVNSASSDDSCLGICGRLCDTVRHKQRHRDAREQSEQRHALAQAACQLCVDAPVDASGLRWLGKAVGCVRVSGLRLRPFTRRGPVWRCASRVQFGSARSRRSD